MPFQKGNKLAGSRAGAKNKSTVLFENILEEEKEGLVRKAIELANAGETSIMNKLLDKILPSLNKNDNANTHDGKLIIEIKNFGE